MPVRICLIIIKVNDRNAQIVFKNKIDCDPLKYQNYVSKAHPTCGNVKNHPDNVSNPWETYAYNTCYRIHVKYP